MLQQPLETPSDSKNIAGKTASPTWLRGHHMGLAAVAILLILSTIALPAWALASEVRTQETVRVAASETINDDLYVAAGDFDLDGTANRDVFAAAGRVNLRGSVFGSLTITGGEIDITGSVGRSARVAGGDVVINGTIGGDLLILGGSITLGPDSLIQGDVRVFGGKLDQQGMIRGDLGGSLTTLSLAGEVTGDTNIDVQNLNVTEQAELAGSLTYVSPSQADIADRSSVGGRVDHDRPSPWGANSGFRGRFFSPLLRIVWMLSAGVLLVALAPRLMSAVGRNMRRPWRAVLVGIASMVAIPLVSVLLMTTIVGLPIGVILLIAFVMALYLSQAFVGQRLGMLILPRSWNDGSRGYLLLAMTIGVVVLGALRFIPIPYATTVVNIVVAVTGLGAAVLLLGQLRPSRRSAFAS